MEPFSLGVLDAVFKVIEERVPFGRALITIASLLIVLSIITLCATYLIDGAMILLGRVPSLGLHPDWSQVLSYIGWGVFGSISVVIVVYAFYAQRVLTQRQEAEKKARTEREERIASALEKLIQQGKL